MNFVRFSISYFCGLNGSIEQYEWFKRLNDRQVNELIGLIDDWLIIGTEPIDSNVWLDRERWTNVDFVTIFVSGTVNVTDPAVIVLIISMLSMCALNIKWFFFPNSYFNLRYPQSTLSLLQYRQKTHCWHSQIWEEILRTPYGCTFDSQFSEII